MLSCRILRFLVSLDTPSLSLSTDKKKTNELLNSPTPRNLNSKLDYQWEKGWSLAYKRSHNRLALGNLTLNSNIFVSGCSIHIFSVSLDAQFLSLSIDTENYFN